MAACACGKQKDCPFDNDSLDAIENHDMTAGEAFDRYEHILWPFYENAGLNLDDGVDTNDLVCQCYWSVGCIALKSEGDDCSCPTCGKCIKALILLSAEYNRIDGRQPGDELYIYKNKDFICNCAVSGQYSGGKATKPAKDLYTVD